jgi:hypothetical protein
LNPEGTIMNQKILAVLFVLLPGGSLFIMGGCAGPQTGSPEKPGLRKSPWSHPLVWQDRENYLAIFGLF